MRKVAHLLVAISNLGFAGGDIEPVDTALVIEPEVSSFYVGLGLSSVSTGNSHLSLGFFDDQLGEDDTGNVLIMAGYDFNPYVAVEGRYMTSVWGENEFTNDSWGIYVKPQYPVTQAFTLYALLGYGGLNVETTGLTLGKLDDTGFQWGVGASYDLNVHFSIFIDYVNIAKNMDADVIFESPYYAAFSKVDSDALSVGITYKF